MPIQPDDPQPTPPTSGMAHDFNNLLTVISGNLALAERHAAGNAKLIRLLNNMRLATERGTQLAQQLMGSPPESGVRRVAVGMAEDDAGFPSPTGAEAGYAFSSAPARHILVVEDDPMVAKVAVTVLEDMGHTVLLSPDAPSALVALGRSGFDLVFSDIVMPGGMSGIELAEHIATEFPQMPVLLASGYSNAALAPGALRFPVLAKPYSVAELSRRVTQMLPG